MPIKIFEDGEVLDASEVNTYFMKQAILIFDDATTRASDFASLANPAYPSEGMFSYLKDDETIYIYTGSGWTAQVASVLDGSITESKIASGAVTAGKIGAGAVTEAKIGSGAVTEAKIGSGAVTEAKIGLGAVTETKIGNDAVTESKINSSIAGSGLSGGSGSALAVNVDNSTIEINSDSLRLKDSGITSAKLGSNLSLTGTSQIQGILETAVLNGSTLTGTVTVNLKSGGVHYFTANSSANWVWNLVGDGSTSLNSMMSVGQSATFSLFATNSTAYKLTNILVDTTATVSVKWFGGSSNAYPSGNANSVDVYTLTVIKRNTNAFDVFASQSRFG